MCMGVSLCIRMITMCVQCPGSTEENIRFPEAGVTVVLSHYVGAENQTPGPLEELPVVLVTELSL